MTSAEPSRAEAEGAPFARERQERLLGVWTAGAGLPAGALPPAAPGIEMPVAETRPEALFQLLTALRDAPALAFDQLSYLTATDETPESPRFRVVYFLASTRHLWRVKIVVRIDEGAPLPSLTNVYRGANWMEREVFDMFGIPLEGHPEPKRILMPEGYLYHPLRKDFPLEGIEPDRLYRDWEAARASALARGSEGS